MNLPKTFNYDEAARDAVANIINLAKTKIGVSQNYTERARTQGSSVVAATTKVPLQSHGQPLVQTCEKFLDDIIRKKWLLTQTFMHYNRYMGSSEDESRKYYFFEVVFSQPTISYPIPQATVSVYFRVEHKLASPLEDTNIPFMYFRIEGHHTDHDVRFITLNPDWLLAVIQMKIKFFKRLESLALM